MHKTHLTNKNIRNSKKIKIEANSDVFDFLNVTLDMKNPSYKPYMKPRIVISYAHTSSNHPPAVYKYVPKGVNDRLSLLSRQMKLNAP